MSNRQALRSKRSFFMILFISLVLVFGLGVILYKMNNPNGLNKSFSLPSQSKLATKENTETEWNIDYFKSVNPNSQIVTSRLVDLDGDDIKDYIILYNNTDPNSNITTKSNVCVMTAYQVVALDLADGDTNFSFSYDDTSLDFNQDTKIAIVYLSDAKKNRILEYHLKVTSNPDKMQTNVKIDANEIKG